MTRRVTHKWLPVLAILPCACAKTQPARTRLPKSARRAAPPRPRVACRGGANEPSQAGVTNNKAAAGTAAVSGARGQAGTGGSGAPQQPPATGASGAPAGRLETSTAPCRPCPWTRASRMLAAPKRARATLPSATISAASGLDKGQEPIAAAPLWQHLRRHDPTMIEADGTYYRFWTGDNTPVATSSDLMNWTNAPSVYRDGYPDWSREWLAGVQGKPSISRGLPTSRSSTASTHLYLSFSAKFGDNISCITHLSTSDIATGDWTDHGPVICTKGNESYNAIDADVGFDARENHIFPSAASGTASWRFRSAPRGSESARS